MAFNIEIEEQRHRDGWRSFVIFAFCASAAVALALMALFLI